MDANASLITRKIPYDKEAESATIGSMLMDEEALLYAVEHLKEEDFYLKQYGLLFSAIADLNYERRDVDYVTLQAKLREKQAPPEVCEIGFISQILENTPTSANYKQYCNIVSDRSLRRRLIKTAERIADDGYASEEDTNKVLNDAESDIFALLQGRGDDDIVPIGQIVMNTLDNIQKASKTVGNVTGIPSGFIDLDNMLAGFQRSDLILIAARPAMGKTAFALNIAEYACFKKNYSVAVFSLEMGKEQLVNRLIAMNATVNSRMMKTGNLSDTDWDKIVESGGVIGKSNLMICDRPGITVNELRSRCRKMKFEQGLDLIVIDYLQLMQGRGRASDSRQNEIAEISRGLKVLARELNIPVIALSQLSRAVDSRPDHKPVLSDLRESGAIEQDADIVMFIYREDYYKPDTDRKGIADIIIAKHRNGSTGEISLVWRAEYTKFGSIERKDIKG